MSGNEKEGSGEPMITKKQISTLLNLQDHFNEPAKVKELTRAEASEKIQKYIERRRETEPAPPRMLADLHTATIIADGKQVTSKADIATSHGGKTSAQVQALIEAQYERAIAREAAGELTPKEPSEKQVEVLRAINEFQPEIGEALNLGKVAKRASKGKISRAEAGLSVTKAKALGADLAYVIGRANRASKSQESDLGR